MGANVEVDGSRAVVRGRTPLTGTRVTAHDLRSGIALVLAGLAADGETVIDSGYLIDRGHAHLAARMRALGADITREISEH
jgi:UDP-N-acetylglucosamine 1-carboxyvinyltransferase